MEEKKRQDKGQELQSLRHHDLQSPFGKPDGFSDSGFFKEMDQFFEDYLPRRWWHHLRHGWPSEAVSQQYMAAPFEGKTPSVDIIDREADFLVKAELPGSGQKRHQHYHCQQHRDSSSECEQGRKRGKSRLLSAGNLPRLLPSHSRPACGRQRKRSQGHLQEWYSRVDHPETGENQEIHNQGGLKIEI